MAICGDCRRLPVRETGIASSQLLPPTNGKPGRKMRKPAPNARSTEVAMGSSPFVPESASPFSGPSYRYPRVGDRTESVAAEHREIKQSAQCMCKTNKQTNKDSSMTSNDELLYYLRLHSSVHHAPPRLQPRGGGALTNGTPSGRHLQTPQGSLLWPPHLPHLHLPHTR